MNKLKHWYYRSLGWLTSKRYMQQGQLDEPFRVLAWVFVIVIIGAVAIWVLKNLAAA